MTRSALHFYIKLEDMDFFFVIGFGVGWWLCSFREKVGAAGRCFGTGKPAGGPLCAAACQWRSYFVVLKFPVPEILTLKSNFNNLINYIIGFISRSE